MPTTNAKVAIELYVDDQGTLRMKEFSADSQSEFKKVEAAGSGAAEKLKASWASVKSAWVEITASIMALRETWNLMNEAAKAEDQKRSFASLAASYGANSDQIIGDLKRVSGGTIDTMTLVKNAGTAMMMGIAPDNVVQLLEVARATTKMTGQTTVKAFEDISLAVGRQSKMILDNLGIILDVDKANEEYAASLHKTSAQLTDTERKQAFMNATLKAGHDLMAKLGPQADTNSDKLERLTATFNDIKLAVGGGLIRAFNFLEGTFEAVAAGALAVSGGIFKIIEGAASLTDKLHMTSGAAVEWKINAEAAFGAAEDLAMKSDKAFKDMRGSNAGMIQGMQAYKNSIDEATKSLEEQEKARKKIVDQFNKEAEEKAQAETEMYEEAGFGAEQYFSNEATELVKKAARWQKAGADVYQVEQWLYDQIGKLGAEAYEKNEIAAGQAMESMQAMSSTLVDQYTEANQRIVDQLDAVGVKVEELDGQNIGLTAYFDGSAVVSGVDSLISKFAQLRAASASASTTSSSPDSDSYENTDPSLSASEVAAAQASYYNSNVTVNVNQQLSRSDVTSIVNEQKRQDTRS
jgi:hypothetical protein